MSPDLRVALSLWLNAYEGALAVDRLSNDAARVRQLPDAIRALTEASTELHRVADEAVESPPDDAEEPRTIRDVEGRPLKNDYLVPLHKETLRSVVRMLAEWDEARDAVDQAEQPTVPMFSKVDRTESNLKRFIKTCRRKAKALAKG